MKKFHIVALMLLLICCGNNETDSHANLEVVNEPTENNTNVSDTKPTTKCTLYYAGIAQYFPSVVSELGDFEDYIKAYEDNVISFQELKDNAMSIKTTLLELEANIRELIPNDDNELNHKYLIEGLADTRRSIDTFKYADSLEDFQNFKDGLQSYQNGTTLLKTFSENLKDCS